MDCYLLYWKEKHVKNLMTAVIDLENHSFNLPHGITYEHLHEIEETLSS